MTRRGKLCRKCLNVVDATPANLIGTAFQMMGETANQEVSKVQKFLISHKKVQIFLKGYIKLKKKSHFVLKVGNVVNFCGLLKIFDVFLF